MKNRYLLTLAILAATINFQGTADAQVRKLGTNTTAKYVVSMSKSQLQRLRQFVSARCLKESAPILRGDANLDGKVDLADMIVMSEFVLQGNTNGCKVEEACDLNETNSCDIFDVAKLADYLYGGPNAVTSLGEPVRVLTAVCDNLSKNPKTAPSPFPTGSATPQPSGNPTPAPSQNPNPSGSSTPAPTSSATPAATATATATQTPNPATPNPSGSPTI